MAFNGDGQKFVGDDGFIKRASFGAEVLAPGALPVPAVYLITAIGTPTGFPVNAYGGASAGVGDILVLKAGDTVTMLAGDAVVTLTLKDQCDVSSWTMEFSKEEIDVTTLCDYVKKYRSGKADMSGTMNGIFTAGITDDTDGYLRQFIDIAKQDGDLSFDRFSQQESIMLGFFYVNIDTALADEMYIVAPFQIYGTGLGGELGSPQSFSANFRFANLSYTDSNGDTAVIEPTFYRLGDGTT
jgi:hypothetical protein